MFEEYYGFRIRPFSKTPDPRFLYLSRAHEEALARLQFAVEEREIAVLTGEVGCGKTTITRALMDSMENCRFILILNPRLTSYDFIKTISMRFNCNVNSDKKSDLLEAIYERVYEDHKSGMIPVIIIDEAHLIPYRETFEEIRLLTNFQFDDKNLLSLILVGQPDLRKKLDLPSLLALKQRIGISYHLNPLNEDEVKAYLEFRIKAGGRDNPLFTDGAVTSIYRYSRGIPRVINGLANMALLEGLSRDATLIDENIIRAAAMEIGLNGYSKDKKET